LNLPLNLAQLRCASPASHRPWCPPLGPVGLRCLAHSPKGAFSSGLCILAVAPSLSSLADMRAPPVSPFSILITPPKSSHAVAKSFRSQPCPPPRLLPRDVASPASPSPYKRVSTTPRAPRTFRPHSQVLSHPPPLSCRAQAIATLWLRRATSPPLLVLQ
jgi:hypothetical protein